MKWIKLKKAMHGHEAGALIQVDEAIAKAYMDAGAAEDGGKGPNEAIEAIGVEELSKALKGFTDEMGATFKAAADNVRKAGTFPTIEPGEQQADKTKSLTDFVKNVVRSANVSDDEGRREAQERLSKAYGSEMKRGMEEGSGTAGGLWTMPTIYEKTILMEAAEEAVIMPGSTNVPLGARAVEWPALDQYQVPTKGSSAMFAGVTVSRKGEVSQRDRTQPKPTTVKLEANDLTAFTQFSRDLQEDSSGMLESMLVKLIGGAIGFRRDWEHIWGSGVGMALGILMCAAILKIRRQTANIITWTDVATMKSRMASSGRKRCVWVAHPFHSLTLETMTDATGKLIYLPNLNPTQGPASAGNQTDTLDGIPVLYSEKMAPPGTFGDFILADRKAYLTGQRSGLEIGLSEHFLFDTDQIALRAKIRDDGQPWVKKPFTLADGAGTNQVSPFVGLLPPA